MLIGIEAGYDFFVSQKVFFTPAVFYRQCLNDDAEQPDKFGLSIGIGVKF